MKNVNEYIRELYVRKDSVLYVGGEIFDTSRLFFLEDVTIEQNYDIDGSSDIWDFLSERLDGVISGTTYSG